VVQQGQLGDKGHGAPVVVPRHRLTLTLPSRRSLLSRLYQTATVARVSTQTIARSTLESFQTVTFFVLVYNFLIDDFGAFEKLAFIPW
jgi:hypothetical protein